MSALKDVISAMKDVLLLTDKVDCGYQRAGVDPSKPASIQLARQLATSDSNRVQMIKSYKLSIPIPHGFQ